MTGQEKLPQRAENAVARFAEGFNCSQAVFSVFAEELGLEKETALRIAAGFGGGMGRLGETCGAVTGAMMVLGLQWGGTSPTPEAKERIYGQVREFCRRFQLLHPSLLCRDLLGCDISTPEGSQAAREKQVFASVCPALVREAAEIVEKMLRDAAND